MKQRLVFDTTNTPDSDSVGSYLRASDGSLITQTTIGGKVSIDVNLAGGDAAAGLFDEDSAHVSGDKGQFMLAVRTDTDTILTSADGDYSPISVDQFGRLRTVTDFDTDFDFIFAEDVAHTNGDLGAYVLNVRQDLPASSTSADGDYQSFKSDALGRTWVRNSAQAAAYSAVSVANTATDLVGTDLANRTRILVYNNDNKIVYLGSDASVTTATGMVLPPGASVEMEVGPTVNLHGIVAAGTANVRILELA